MIPSPPSARLLHLIRKVQLGVRARLEEAVREFQLTVAQYTVLSILSRSDGLSSAELSRHSEVTPQSMNELVSTLEEKRLISRTQDPSNRRILRVSLTPAGASIITECERRIDALEKELFHDLPPEQLTQFRQSLGRILSRLRAPQEV